MGKIRLDIDALKVESFATGGGESGRVGTVNGHDSTTDCDPNSGQVGCADVGTYFTRCACETQEFTCKFCDSKGVTYCGNPTCNNSCDPENTCQGTCAFSECWSCGGQPCF